jgi:hypothetical protein
MYKVFKRILNIFNLKRNKKMKNQFQIDIKGLDGNEIIQKYLNQINEDTKDWDCKGINMPWFRGQKDSTLALIPEVFRRKKDDKEGYYDEFWLSTTFRNRAPNFGDTPDNRDDIDKWLFLMRHMELPTRLLDWSESALVSLFMAVCESKKAKKPAVWMINPVALNHLSLNINPDLDEATLKENNDIFPNTWVDKKPAKENIRLAFKHPKESLSGYNPTAYPLAIQLTYCHSRMSAQKGCFTIYGIDDRDFEQMYDSNSLLVKKGYFKKYVFNENLREGIYFELQKLGITYSSIFPDLIGLSKELKDRFFFNKNTNSNKLKTNNLILQTATIESENLQDLHIYYGKFINEKMQDDNFYYIDRTDFHKENNKFYYFISYWNKT